MLLDILVSAGLGMLLVCTALYALGLKFRGLRRLHTLGLVPQWSFFAPTPGVQNLYLLYRDIHLGGEPTAWRMVHHMDSDRGPLTFVWNPRRRLRKALHDLITGLEIGGPMPRPELVQLSMPYLLIVHHLSSLPRLDGVWATQFLVMVSDPYKVAQVGFQSACHRL